MGIIKGIARHERNRAARRAIKKAVKSRGLLGKLVRGAIIYTIVSTLATSVLPQAVSVAATFKDNGPYTKEEFVEQTKDWVQSKVDDFTGTFTKIVDDTKLASEEAMKEMAQDFGEKAEIFANENGTTFLKASIARVVDSIYNRFLHRISNRYTHRSTSSLLFFHSKCTLCICNLQYDNHSLHFE